MSFWKVGPTELRLLLAAGNAALLFHPSATAFGTGHRLFDVGGSIGIAGLGITLVVSFVRNTRTLYWAEPLAAGQDHRSGQATTYGRRAAVGE